MWGKIIIIPINSIGTQFSEFCFASRNLVQLPNILISEDYTLK